MLPRMQASPMPMNTTSGLVSETATAPTDPLWTCPDVVFIGMGEACIRGNIQPGDGLYKSTDGAKTWTHIGFKDSDAISKIRIHPTNPDIVFVADFGKFSVPRRAR